MFPLCCMRLHQHCLLLVNTNTLHLNTILCTSIWSNSTWETQLFEEPRDSGNLGPITHLGPCISLITIWASFPLNGWQ